MFVHWKNTMIALKHAWEEDLGFELDIGSIEEWASEVLHRASPALPASDAKWDSMLALYYLNNGD